MQNRSDRFSIEGSIQSIKPGDSFIKNIKFLYPWNTSQIATTIPAGERFDFVVDYKCINTLGKLLDVWSMSIVFWDDERDIEGYYFMSTASCLLGVNCSPTSLWDNAARIANNYDLIMPAHNVILHFNMFANDDATPTQRYPNKEDWSKVR